MTRTISASAETHKAVGVIRIGPTRNGVGLAYCE